MKPSVCKILIVEDNPDNLAIYRTIFEHEGFDVLSAMTGVEGLSMTKEHMPEVIVMDIALPLMDGYEVTGHIKSDPLLSRIPIIALTARAPMHEPNKEKNKVFDSYLLKPIEPKAVVAEVRRYLQVSQPEVL